MKKLSQVLRTGLKRLYSQSTSVENCPTALTLASLHRLFLLTTLLSPLIEFIVKAIQVQLNGKYIPGAADSEVELQAPTFALLTQPQ